jgi:N-acyl-D-amino-acid deacylase
MKIVKDGGAGIVCHAMKTSDIRTFYKQSWVMVSSDGGIGSRHPRGAGTYPKVLGRFVRELRWLTLAQAISKMTFLPAQRFQLRDRGLLKPGMKADLVLFDAGQIIDRATFREPQLLSDGVVKTFVNGIEVWSNGKSSGKRPGKALRFSRTTI